MPGRRPLHPEIHPLHPTALDAWRRCRRQYLLGWVLRLPGAQPEPSEAAHGRRVHDLLRFLHEQGPVDDPHHVADVLAAHGAGEDTVRLVAAHLARRPAGAPGHHEVTVARFHRRPPPLFMAVARIDVIWVHDGLLDARDHKTGGRWLDRVADDARARLQAWTLAPHARRRGLRLQLRYEHLAPEVDDDPEPWEPDDDDLAAVEDELVATVAEIRAETDWAATDDPAACARCAWRELCAVSPGGDARRPG